MMWKHMKRLLITFFLYFHMTKRCSLWFQYYEYMVNTIVPVSLPIYQAIFRLLCQIGLKVYDNNYNIFVQSFIYIVKCFLSQTYHLTNYICNTKRQTITNPSTIEKNIYSSVIILTMYSLQNGNKSKNIPQPHMSKYLIKSKLGLQIYNPIIL